MKIHSRITVLLLLLFTSCSSYLMNIALNHKGIYDDQVKAEKLSNNKNEIIFIPMHHLGTPKFYNDVTKKIDSLKGLGYLFFYEKVKKGEMTKAEEDTILRKLRKVSGITNQNKNYKRQLDSIRKVRNIRLKKELIMQPSYSEMGLDTVKSINADLSYKELISLYESKYGIIELDSCDYETSLHKTSSCKSSINKERKKDVVLNFRNNKVIEEIIKRDKSKIAIIYGAAHFNGIKDSLISIGYTLAVK